MNPKNIKMNYSLVLLFILFLFAVSFKNTKQTSGKSKVPIPVDIQVNEKQSMSPSDDDIMKRGQLIYNKLCLACHQVNGSGVPMMFPPITQSDFIKGDNEKLIKLILQGMSGPIEIKGEHYNKIMPPQNNLNDHQISDLLTFLRRSFGNSGASISAGEVSRVRKLSRSPK
jgi:mono/diheme cytochrome c family protein